jgi:hypothetical protein
MFTAGEGAEDHCQAGSPLVSAQRTFDWLQEISAAHRPQHRISRQGRQPPPRPPADMSRGSDPRQPARAELRALSWRISIHALEYSPTISPPCRSPPWSIFHHSGRKSDRRLCADSRWQDGRGRAAQKGHFWRRILCQVVCWALEAFGQPLAGDGGMRGLEGADRWQALGWWPQRRFGEIAGQGANQRGHGVRAGRAARP